jgi:cysteine synthase A
VSIENTIGNTPLVRLGEKLYAKLETFNPTGSIKDRVALYILRKAEREGEIKDGHTIVEASSGNTGIAFAMLGSVRGYKVKIIMPCNMSDERKQMMKLFGAEVVEVGHNNFREAIEMRDAMVGQNKNHWSPRQFENPDNVECHEVTTGREIIKQLFIKERKNVSALIAGAGTGGTIMGVRRALIKLDRSMSTILVAPAEDAKTHGIQGINDGADFLVDRSLINDEIKISTEDARERAKRLAKEHGMLVGISAGANVLGAERWLAENNIDGVAVTFLCDRGERYMSLF